MGLPKTEAYKRNDWDRELARKLYYEGYCDRQIAELCDTTFYAVRGWRRRGGLEANRGPYPNAKKKKKKPVSSLSEMAAEAKAHGMTYGQYVASLSQEGKS